MLQLGSVVSRNGVVQFLNGGDDQVRIFTHPFFIFKFSKKLLYQTTGIIRRINTAIFKSIELLHGLIVQIFTVYYKYYFVYLGNIH